MAAFQRFPLCQFLPIVLAAGLAAGADPVRAAWGDVSYDPAPPLIDQDKNAQFDTFGFLTGVVSSSNGLATARQDFESGFSGGQAVTGWVGLGNVGMRFGFGTSLDHIAWSSRIGQVAPASSEFGLTHPRGTYGNAPGVAGDPRNYIADHYFLTGDTAPGGSAAT